MGTPIRSAVFLTHISTPDSLICVPTAADPTRPPRGLSVGPYLLRARLGEGGMGVVHLAQKPGEGPVALKLLRPHIVGDDEARQRLAREVNSLSRVPSPRVAEIIDADPWGDIPYVATRYVPGLSLHDYVLEEGPINGADLVWFAACLAEALSAVHAAGVLHRDVKPGNVLMEGRSPVLIDFGLARVADDPRLTQTGWLLGTPGYLAPEILYGDEATPASDVHAWAATVAHAGAGRGPYGGGPAMAIMDRVRRGEHDLCGVDAPLRPLLAACLDPDPRRRPSLPQVRAAVASWQPGTGDLTLPLVQPPVPTPVPTPGTTPAPTSSTSLAPPPAPGTLLDASAPRVGPDRVSAAARARRVALEIGLGIVVAASVAAAPYVAALMIAALVWLVRAMSRAGSAAAERRTLRGHKWWDPVWSVVSLPWHLLAAVPGTVVLLLWSCAAALAAALLCFLSAQSLAPALAIVGFVGALALWWGPGAARIRRPVRRGCHFVATDRWGWLTAIVVVIAATGVLGVVAQSGTSWAPAADHPLAGVSWPDWPRW